MASLTLLQAFPARILLKLMSGSRILAAAIMNDADFTQTLLLIVDLGGDSVMSKPERLHLYMSLPAHQMTCLADVTVYVPMKAADRIYSRKRALGPRYEFIWRQLAR